jgi:hypothetical protein
MLDLSVSTEDVGLLCTYITCCNECAQTGASYLVCYTNDLGVCGSIECRVDGTSSTNPGGIGDPAVNPGETIAVRSLTREVIFLPCCKSPRFITWLESKYKLVTRPRRPNLHSSLHRKPHASTLPWPKLTPKVNMKEVEQYSVSVGIRTLINMKRCTFLVLM